ncbi:MAG: hypothetical protein RR505_13635, partial [Raoultibacter sp.]
KENGDCLGIYNPTLAYEEYYVNHGDVPIKRYRPEINPEWELEATSENEQKILDECERLMIEARMMEN